uniref:Ig-like domain-containing protein n=1 Tax=Canis lupus dingo TaxID=286419 RepID=A0A8C0JTS3_CANLU
CLWSQCDPYLSEQHLSLLVLGADSQTVVTQDSSVSVSPGGTVTLTCGLSSGSVTTSNYPSWYQQTQGRSPRMLIYDTSSRPPEVPDHFPGSISGNKAALTITGTQPEDEADYYCQSYDDNLDGHTVLWAWEEVRH